MYMFYNRAIDECLHLFKRSVCVVALSDITGIIRNFPTGTVDIFLQSHTPSHILVAYNIMKKTSDDIYIYIGLVWFNPL